MFTGHEDDEDQNDDDNEGEEEDFYHYKSKQLKMALRCHQKPQPPSKIAQNYNIDTNGLVNDATILAPTVINMSSHGNTGEFDELGQKANINNNNNNGNRLTSPMSPTSSLASSSTASIQQQHYSHHNQHYHHHHHHQQMSPYHQTQQHSSIIQSQSANNIQQQQHLSSSSVSTTNNHATSSTSSSTTSSSTSSSMNRRDHNIDYSTLFVQLSGTLPTLYRCVSCNKIVSNRWHHANIHRPQSHECPVCGQKFTRRDNMKAHCKIKHADIKDRFFSHYVHM